MTPEWEEAIIHLKGMGNRAISALLDILHSDCVADQANEYPEQAEQIHIFFSLLAEAVETDRNVTEPFERHI
jgi:hypothetical protein